MELVVVLAVLLVALHVMWKLTDAVTGDVFRPVVRLTRTMLRRITGLVWTNPMRRHGFLKTVWLWLLVLAVSLSLCCLGVVPVAPAGAVGFGGVLVFLWGFVVLGWWVMRWWARRRYTPRPLHTRRRRR
jgi:hypothetical protein